MTPLYDTPSGTPAERVAVRFPSGVTIRGANIGHDVITLYDDTGTAFLIDRPTHPGAGLGFEIADHVDYDR